MATLLVVGLALVAAVTVVHLLGLALGEAVLGTVDLQGAVAQATLSVALTFTGDVPPGAAHG